MAGTEIRRLAVLNGCDDVAAMTDLYLQRKPFVMKGCDIGACTEKWDVNYLSEAVGSQEVKVHVSESPLMDFVGKNFFYKSLPFNELIKRASETEHSDYFISRTEYYYLRSIGSNPRKDVADIKQQFPKLAADILFPQFIPEDSIFSSVFRVASAGLSLWTHYDIMDNMLIQVRGQKRAVLFPPKDVPRLYLNGDKSEVLDIDKPDLKKYPEFIKAKRYEHCLDPGDILFIPALWFHNMKSLDCGIAVNVFWKNLDDSLYDKKDPYGNKDLLPAKNAFSFLEKALTSLDQLPDEYKLFYHERLIANIKKKMPQLECS